MEPKKNLLTQEGKQKLEDELQDLKLNKRKEISMKIKLAREQGDLSENAEYDAAKDKERDNEARIEEIENILKNAEVIDTTGTKAGEIHIGSFVKVKDVEFDEILDYHIVGATEADSLKGKISNESPLGSVLIGSKVGETVTVETEAGSFQYEIVEIGKSKGRK